MQSIEATAWGGCPICPEIVLCDAHEKEGIKYGTTGKILRFFEDSQRMYESNPRLISAIKKSNEKQEFFAGDCQIMLMPGGFMKRRPGLS